MKPPRPIDYQRPAISDGPRIRPVYATVSFLLIAIGLVGLYAMFAGFQIMPLDDSGPGSPQAIENHRRSLWFNAGCAAMPFGLSGVVLLPLSIRWNPKSPEADETM